jgi:hypothetical protein
MAAIADCKNASTPLAIAAMQQPRKILTAKTTPCEGPLETADPCAAIFSEAISRRLLVAAVYNKAPVIMAPHILYTKHDEMFVDAVVIERDGKPPKEVKLGSFKLAGLTETTLTTRLFTPNPLFDPASAKYAGTTIRAVRARSLAAVR